MPRDLLIDPIDYAAFVRQNKPISRQKVIQFAKQIGIAAGIVIGRLQHDKHLPYTHLNRLKETFKWVDTQ